MFDMLTRAENQALWNRLASATRRLHNMTADLNLEEWQRFTLIECDILDLRDDLTAAYCRAVPDA